KTCRWQWGPDGPGDPQGGMDHTGPKSLYRPMVPDQGGWQERNNQKSGKTMKTRTILVGILSLSLFSCLDNIGQKTANTNLEISQLEEEMDFKYWTWITADPDRDDASYRDEFEKY